MNENENITVNEADIDAAWAEDDGPSTETGAPEKADQPDSVQQQAADQQPAAPDAEEPAEAQERADQPKEQPADQPELFTLQYRGEQIQVTRDEVITLAQKGRDYDTVRQERDQLRQYRQEADPALSLVKSYAQRNGLSVEQYIDTVRKQELLAQGINEQTADAQISMEKRQAALQAQTAEAEAARNRQEAIAAQARQRQEARRQGMVDFLRAYPSVKPADIPREVWDRVAQGESLTAAYTMHRNQQLEAELAAERQNRQNQGRTTGSLSAQREGDGKSEIDKWWYEDD